MRMRRQQPPPRVSTLMRTDVRAVVPGARLADVAKRMWADRTGAVAVMSGAELVGIITERDLLRAVADGIDPETVSAAERMTPAPRTIPAEDVASHAAELMVELGFRHLPVVSDGEVVGMISARDLLPLGRGTARELLGCEPW